MNVQLLNTIQAFIQKTLLEYYSDPSINVFDKLMDFCKDYYDKPVHSLAEIKMQKNTKLRGDIFEHFCLLYLKHVRGMSEVWLLNDVSDKTLKELKLKRQDMGIDLISVDYKGRYYAIQAKYRQKTKKTSQGIGWKQLSTFYALVTRSGPYARHIVMTNTDFVRHVGKKTKTDLSICRRSFQKTSISDWREMGGIPPGQRLGHAPIPELFDAEGEVGEVVCETDVRGENKNGEGKEGGEYMPSTDKLPPPNSAEGRALRLAHFDKLDRERKELKILNDKIESMSNFLGITD